GPGGPPAPALPVDRGTTPAVPRTPPVDRGTTPAVPRTPPVDRGTTPVRLGGPDHLDRIAGADPQAVGGPAQVDGHGQRPERGLVQDQLPRRPRGAGLAR